MEYVTKKIMQQYEVTWTEKNFDGSETTENIKTCANSLEGLKQQVQTIGNVVRIESITKII